MSEQPEGTLTGRIKAESIHDFMERWMGNPTPTYLRKPIASLENIPEIPILGVDFSEVEARTVAMLVGHRDGQLFVEKILEGDFLRGQKADLIIIDEIVPMISQELFEVLDMPEPAETGYHKPVKQNGRDASYLALDPTKQHRRNRCKKK